MVVLMAAVMAGVVVVVEDECSMCRFAMDMGVKAMDVVGAVVDGAVEAVRVHHGVVAANLIADLCLLVRLDVAGGHVADGVGKVVVGVVVSVEVACRRRDVDDGRLDVEKGGRVTVVVRPEDAMAMVHLLVVVVVFGVVDAINTLLLLVADELLLDATSVDELLHLVLSLLVLQLLVLADLLALELAHLLLVLQLRLKLLVHVDEGTRSGSH